MKKTNMTGFEKTIPVKIAISTEEITKLLLSYHGFVLMHIKEFRDKIVIYDHRKPFFNIISNKVDQDVPFLNPLIHPLLSKVTKEIAREFNKPAEVSIKQRRVEGKTYYAINFFPPKERGIKAVLFTIESDKVIQDESLWSLKGERKIIALTDEDNPVVLSDQNGITVIGRDIFANLKI